MRDPKRIDEILIMIGDIWKKFPDLRLGQLISNSLPGNIDGNGLYNLEDDELKDKLFTYYNYAALKDAKENKDIFATGLTTSETTTYHNNYDLPIDVSTSNSSTETNSDKVSLDLAIAKCKIEYYDIDFDVFDMDYCLMAGNSMEDITEQIYYYYEDYDIVSMEIEFLGEDEECPIHIDKEMFDTL